MPRADADLPPLTALRAFAATARLGSLSHAAEELHVSKSAVSHQIRALEASLGSALLVRGGTTTRACPTAAGQILLKAVDEAMDGLSHACQRIRGPQRRTRSRRLTVAANPAFCGLWLAPRVAGFAARQPGVDVSLRIVDDALDWQRDGIDVAILRVRGEVAAQTADDAILATETIFPVASPMLVGGGLPAGDPGVLHRHPLLQEGQFPSVSEYDWGTWFDRLHAGPLPTERLVRYSGYSPVIGAAVAGAGIALGRSPLIDYELASGRLVRLFPGQEMAGTWRFLMQRNPHAAPHAVVRNFLRFMLDEAKP